MPNRIGQARRQFDQARRGRIQAARGFQGLGRALNIARRQPLTRVGDRRIETRQHRRRFVADAERLRVTRIDREDFSGIGCGRAIVSRAEARIGEPEPILQRRGVNRRGRRWRWCSRHAFRRARPHRDIPEREHGDQGADADHER